VGEPWKSCGAASPITLKKILAEVMRKFLRLFLCSTIATLLFGLAPPTDAAVDPAAL
jgi:hypothetical protein